MDNRQYLFKYGEKALEFYKKSLPKDLGEESESGGDSPRVVRDTEVNYQHGNKKCLNLKKLVLDQGRQGLKIRKSSKKNLSRTKSRPQLLESSLSPKNMTTAAPTLRKPCKQSHSQSNSRKLHSSIGNLKKPPKKQPRPVMPFSKSSKQQLQTKIKAALNITDFTTFAHEVLSNLNQLIYSQCTIGKWLKSFKACFERLFAVAEDYIGRYARADQEVKRLKKRLREVEEENRGLSRVVDKERTFESDANKVIMELTRKLEKLEKREKLLVNTFEILKNQGETEEGCQITPMASRNVRIRSSAGKELSGSRHKDISDYLPPQ